MRQKKGVCYYYIIWFEKYHVIKILADNSNRTVYLTKHIMLNCYRIIKKIKKISIMSQTFFNEVNSLKNLRHPNIPVIYDTEEDNDFYYIIEEFIEGESLRTYRFNQKIILESKIINFAIQLCDVIDALHSRKESILYLDLKPDNLIVCNEVLKLIDFGTAILEQDVSLKRISYGTKGYAAPEQYNLNKIDKRSDIYGIGSVLYFLITGCSFKDTKEDSSICETLPIYSNCIKLIIMRCLKNAPSQRFQTIKQLKNQLEHLQQLQLSITPFRFVVAGADRRMGTTHFAMLLTDYLNHYIGNALYIETENKGVLHSIKTNSGEQLKFPAVSGSPEQIIDKYVGYQFYICDCGVWTEQKEKGWKYDAIFLTVGCKPWEMKMTENIIAHFKQTAVYLTNFQESIILNHNSILSIPYEPNPFLLHKKQKVFIKECIKRTGCSIMQQKRMWFQKKLY